MSLSPTTALLTTGTISSMSRALKAKGFAQASISFLKPSVKPERNVQNTLLLLLLYDSITKALRWVQHPIVPLQLAALEQSAPPLIIH